MRKGLHTSFKTIFALNMAFMKSLLNKLFSI